VAQRQHRRSESAAGGLTARFLVRVQVGEFDAAGHFSIIVCRVLFLPGHFERLSNTGFEVSNRCDRAVCGDRGGQHSLSLATGLLDWRAENG